MAVKADKQPQNVPGPWYVDTSCALCRLCLEEPPNLLNYNDDERAVHFFKQPETTEETAAAKRAMDVCPNASDWKRRLKIKLGAPSGRWLHGFQMVRFWLRPLAHSEKLGFSCGCLLK
jgi:ferredoxin